jgi:hypothetical protein
VHLTSSSQICASTLARPRCPSCLTNAMSWSMSSSMPKISRSQSVLSCDALPCRGCRSYARLVDAMALRGQEAALLTATNSHRRDWATKSATDVHGPIRALILPLTARTETALPMLAGNGLTQHSVRPPQP